MASETQSREQRGLTTATKAKVILMGIIGVLVLIVIFQNLETVTPRLFFWSIPMPRALLLFIMLAIGFGAGALVTGTIYRRRAK